MANALQTRPSRIAVFRDQQLVPLLESALPAPGGEQPWAGILLERHSITRSEIPEHKHPDLCLHMQVSGTDDFEWWSQGRNSIEHTAPGSLILLPPGTTDRLHWKGRSERFVLSVQGDSLAALAESAGLKRMPEFHENWSFRDAAIQTHLESMGREARAGWPLGALYADLLALGFKTKLLQRLSAHPLSFPVHKGGLALPKLRDAMEWINANLSEDIRLDAIATALQLSPSHFAHEFRNSTGQTPYQYLLDQRIARAKDLLKSTRAPVQNISELTGFRSPVNFTRTFRQRVGVTPETWRKS